MSVQHPDMRTVADMLAQRIDALARELCGTEPPSRAGDTWRFRRKGSLAVQVAGPKRGSWFDHEAGTGGDALAFVAHMRGMSMRAAWEWALAWLGIDTGPAAPAASRPAPAPPRKAPEASQTAATARRIWREAVPAEGTLVKEYLRSRGLLPPPDAPLRFHPACPRGNERVPAMVAAMTDPVTGEWRGVHRTFLADDGSGKALGADGSSEKMMLGNVGVICLTPDADVTTGLGICEGIETGLALVQRLGWAPIWVATSAGSIRTFPVLDGIEAVTVFADADTAGMDAARVCCERHAEAGREASILVPPAGDWDDALPRRSAA